MVEFRCGICSKIFDSEEALEMHNSAKHPQGEKKGFNFRKLRNYAIFIIILGALIGLLVWGVSSMIKESSACENDPVTEINIGGHKDIKLHKHSIVNIVINGKKEIIPANIGVSPGIMRPLHTHELDNEIHMEGPCARDFKLGEFFEVWGKKFNSQCIFDYCTDNGTLTMKVNGVENDKFESYILRDDDEIEVEYKSS